MASTVLKVHSDENYPKLLFDKIADETILELLQHLKNDDIFRLMKVEPTLSRVALDWSLWRQILFDEPISLHDLHIIANIIWRMD